jgi:leader peptidase (prepilin peptidase)/N-methyltransferase
LLAVALALAGLCLGSFLATAAARSVDGFAGLWSGRSRCPACATRLDAVDLVPLLSWLRLRGRCRHCGAPIAVAYPLVEVGAGLIGVLPGWVLPLPAALVCALLGWWLLGLALIDLETCRLPDRLSLPLLPLGLGLVAAAPRLGLAMPTPVLALLGGAAAFLVLAGLRWAYARLRDREGLGLGDAKLAAAAGVWLGPEALPSLLLLAAALGLLLAVVRERSLAGDRAVPFGPPLALAFWLLFLAAQWG